MDSPPVRDGAVRIEDGLIVEVSDRLQPDRRFADAVILPGLVNAHTHLEYGSMSAMGDGLPFSPWIEQLIERKSGLVRDDYLAQSHAGVHACLAGGVTTIADCSYPDTVAEAAIAQGLRAIVYLEAFSDQGDPAGMMAGRLDALPSDPLITPGRWPTWPACSGPTRSRSTSCAPTGTRSRSWPAWGCRPSTARARMRCWA